MYTPDQLRRANLPEHRAEMRRREEEVYAAVRQRCTDLVGTPTMHVTFDQERGSDVRISDSVIERLRRDRFHVHRYIHFENPPDSAHDQHWVTVCWGDDAYIRERGWHRMVGWRGLLRDWVGL